MHLYSKANKFFPKCVCVFNSQYSFRRRVVVRSWPVVCFSLLRSNLDIPTSSLFRSVDVIQSFRKFSSQRNLFILIYLSLIMFLIFPIFWFITSVIVQEVLHQTFFSLVSFRSIYQFSFQAIYKKFASTICVSWVFKRA